MNFILTISAPILNSARKFSLDVKNLFLSPQLLWRKLSKSIGVRYQAIPVRLRLSLTYAAWMATVFCMVGFGVYQLVERNLIQSVDGALYASAKSIRDSRTNLFSSSPSGVSESILRSFFGEQYINPFAQIVDLSGRISEKTPHSRISLPVTPLASERAERGLTTLETFKLDQKELFRQITLPILSNGIFTGDLVQVGAPLNVPMRTLQNLKLMLWIIFPVTILLSVFFGYRLTGKALRPVVDIAKLAKSLQSDQLSSRLELPLANDELKKLALTLNGMLDRLEDAFSRISKFSSDVSHELRTPLSVIRGEAEFALKKVRTESDYRESLEAIRKEGLHMSSTVEDLLLLARVQNPTTQTSREVLYSDDLAARLLDSLKAELDYHQILLEVEVAKSFYFVANENYIMLALRNLVINALKHAGVMNRRVVFKMETIGEEVQLTVKDFGCGIPADKLPFLFDPFYRADESRQRRSGNGGTGLGLSIVKALAEVHQGRVEVESVVNQGTEFKLIIPQRLKTKPQIHT